MINFFLSSVLFENLFKGKFLIKFLKNNSYSSFSVIFGHQYIDFG